MSTLTDTFYMARNVRVEVEQATNTLLDVMEQVKTFAAGRGELVSGRTKESDRVVTFQETAGA